jgi:hypothetical protein
MVKWQVDKVIIKSNDALTKQQFDEITNRQNDKLMK